MSVIGYFKWKTLLFLFLFVYIFGKCMCILFGFFEKYYFFSICNIFVSAGRSNSLISYDACAFTYPRLQYVNAYDFKPFDLTAKTNLILINYIINHVYQKESWKVKKKKIQAEESIVRISKSVLPHKTDCVSVKKSEQFQTRKELLQESFQRIQELGTCRNFVVG